MKAAVIGPKIIRDEWLDIHTKIKEILLKNGVAVDFSYFERTTDEDAADLEKAYKMNQTIIRKNDFIVVETTRYSGGIGYFIADALSNRTPVLALFNKERGDLPSNIIKASSISKRLEFKEYVPDELDEIIKDYVRNVKVLLDTKFILNLPSHLDRFLEYCSFKRGIPKSHIVREAIEALMREYREEGWNLEKDV